MPFLASGVGSAAHNQMDQINQMNTDNQANATQPSHLEREIQAQPDLIANLIEGQMAAVQSVARAIQEFDPTFVCIAARGTSDNAARYAKYLFGIQNRLPVMLAAPSLHTIYDAPPNLSRALVIGISQSGRAEDVRKVLQNAAEQGALTLAITNYDDSPLAQAANHHLALTVGEEISIAATKTYTAQLTLIALLSVALRQQQAAHIAALRQLPGWVQQALTLNADTAWMARYRYMATFAAIGRGYNLATAIEISLKVKELAYIASEGYSEADFRHGPIAIVQPSFPVMLVAPSGPMLHHMADLSAKLAEREAEIIMISDDAEMLKRGTKQMQLPTVPDWVSPIVAVVPGQIFAAQQAIIRGYSVDKPRGLSKVTVTT